MIRVWRRETDTEPGAETMTTAETYDAWMSGQLSTDEACDAMADALESEEKATKLADLDAAMSSLSMAIASTPNRLWGSSLNRLRMNLNLHHYRSREALAAL
jgi:hypothetical protein